MEIKETKRTLRIYVDDKLMLINSPSVPFVSVGDDSARRALSHAHFDAKQRVLRFSSGRHWLSVVPSERDGALFLEFHSSSQKWGHVSLCFVSKNEPVFGVGALDTISSLKGRRVSCDMGDSTRYLRPADGEVVRRALPLFSRRHETRNPSRFFFDGSMRWYEVTSGGRTQFDFTSRSRHQVDVEGGFKTVKIGQARSGAEVFEGKKTSPKPPMWCRQGSILSVSGGTDRLLLGIDTLSRAGVTVSGVYIRDWTGGTDVGEFYDLQYSGAQYKRLPELLDKLNKRGIPSMARITPLVSQDSSVYEVAQAANLLIKSKSGGALLSEFHGGMAGCLDMTNAEARAFLVEMVKKNVFGIGFSGVFADFFAPSGGVLSNGMLSDERRVGLCELFLKTLADLCAKHGPEAALFAGSGTGLGIAHAVAAEGQGADWAVGEGLRHAVNEAVSLAASGVAAPFIDVGAHLASVPPRIASEMIVRWAETASFLPVHMIPLSPLIFDDEDTLRQVMHFARLHMSLAPYINVLFDVYKETGLPPVRHMWTMHPELSDAHRTEGVFSVGDDIIIAAVTRPAATEIRVALPEGRWQRLGGGMYDGEKSHTVGTLAGNPAVFLRDDRSQLVVR